MYGDIEEFSCPRKFFSYESMVKANARRSGRLIGQRNLISAKLVTKAVKFIEDNLEKLNFTTEPTLVHNDLNQTNIIVNKDNNNRWNIEAILDFEWAFSGNPIKDLFGIIEDFSLNKKLEKLFLETYFDGKFGSLEEFNIEQKINIITSLLDTTAFGWIHFHPTNENLAFVKKTLEEILN